MKKVISIFAILLGCALLGTQGDAQDKDKKEPPKVGALAPHDLDGAFEKGRDPTGLTNGLLNSPLFQKAVINALKAKQEMEAKYKGDPKLSAATPAQAARKAFLETINAGKAKVEEKKTDK